MERLSRGERRESDTAVERAARDASGQRARLAGAQPRSPEVGAYVAGLGSATEPAAIADDVVARAQAGDERAREELLERYLPLVVAVARSHRADGLELADLVQEGCVGLLRALARYDPGRGTSFSAFASWWIRQSVQELRSDFVRPFRLPPKALRQLAQLKSEHDRVYAAERRRPSLAELAERTAIDLAQAEALVRADPRPRSLDEPASTLDDNVGVLGDVVEDPLSTDAYEEVLDALASAQLRALLGHLSDREREILASRFGLDEHSPERLSDIGERLGISTERVRQLEARALAKLRRAA